MGQKASLLSHHDRHSQRGGSFHISSQANRRREAFKAAKKTHFSFGDEPSRHSIHQGESTGTQGSRRHKPSAVTAQSSGTKPFSPPKSISSPEKEFNFVPGSLSTNKQAIICQRSFNSDFPTLLNIPEPSHDFSFLPNANRSQSPADSVNRSFHGTSCNHHSSLKLIEDEDLCSEHSNQNYKNSPLLSLSRTRDKISPSQSPLGYNRTSDTVSSRTQVKHGKSHRTPSPKLVNIKSATIDNHKKNRSHLLNESGKSSSQGKERSEKYQTQSSSPQQIKKRQAIPFRNPIEMHRTIDLSQENLVAALLPPSPLSQREKKISLAPHKLSPYNLSPRSLSPSQMSLQSLASGNSNPYLSKEVGNNRDNFMISDIQSNFNVKPKSGFNMTPDIVINSAGIKKSIDYSPEDLDIAQNYERKNKDSTSSGLLGTQNYNKTNNKSNMSNEFFLFGGIGGDLFSINSKSDTSLSSMSFHKTPSIGLSPTGERGGFSNFFLSSENKFQMHHPTNEVVHKLKDYNQGLEKSLSMEYFKAKSSPNQLIDDKAKYQSKREKEQESVVKPQKLALTRRFSLISQIVWPRSVPEELNSLSCLDFQGHQLLSWLCHWCGPHFKSGQKSDLYLLGCQMCTCLIACNQLISGRRSRSNTNTSSDVSMSKIFQPEHMYRWNASMREAQNDDIDSNDKKMHYMKKLNKNCSRCQGMLQEIHQRDLDHSYDIQRLKQEQELEIFKVKNEGVMKMCQLNDKVEQLERQVEKYRILAGIEGLARQMWHEEALTANPNLVMSKSPTLQSISTNSNNLKSFNSTKSCSTDTSDLDESLQPKPTEQTQIPFFGNIFQQGFIYTPNSLSNHPVSPLGSNLNKKKLKDSPRQHAFISEAEKVQNEEDVKPKKLQRVPSINESPSNTQLDEISTQLDVDSPTTNSLDNLISSKAITADAIKRWLDLQIPMENIDMNLLKAFEKMIPNNAEISENSKSDNNKNSASSFLAVFWNELNLVPHLEEKVHFLYLYKSHIYLIQCLEFKIHQFSFVAHFLENSESLNNILSLIMEICNLKSLDDHDLSLPLDLLKQLKNMHLQSDGSSVLSIVMERYIQIYFHSNSNGSINFPLPEPNDLAMLATDEMALEQLSKDLSPIEEGVKSMNHISRCIVSCSRQTLSVSDISVYSSKLVDVIKKAQNELGILKEYITQCEKQYSNLQHKFKTTVESKIFFYQWLDFAQELKIMWIKNIANIRRLQRDSSNKKRLKPVGKVIPRRPNDQVVLFNMIPPNNGD